MFPMSPTVDLRAVGRDLDAQYLLHGSIQRGGDLIRITTELVAAETGEVVRADRLNGSVADVFDLQDRIAVEVIRSLAPQVRDRELHRAMQKKPDDLDAYQLALVGYDQMFSLGLHDIRDGANQFRAGACHRPRRGRRRCPTAPFGTCSAWRADGLPNALSELDTARALAERALERNSADPLANAVSGYTLSHCKHDHVGALEQLNRAIELTPNLALAFAYRAAVQVRCERYQDALRDAGTNLRLSPRDRHAWFAEMIWLRHTSRWKISTLPSSTRTRVANVLPDESDEPAHSGRRSHGERPSRRWRRLMPRRS